MTRCPESSFRQPFPAYPSLMEHLRFHLRASFGSLPFAALLLASLAVWIMDLIA